MSKTSRILIGAALVASLASVASPAEAGERAASYGLWCGLKAADLASTEVFLQRGYSEANPLLQDRGVRIGTGVATCALAAEVDARLKDKTKTRRVFRFAAFVGYGFVVRHNLGR